MTQLVAMRPDHFASFAERAIASFAHENVMAGRWEADGAEQRARVQFRNLLPQGSDTRGHYLYEILGELGGPTVGDVWIELTGSPSHRIAHLYDIYVDPAYRGNNHAAGALQIVEARCRELGARSLALHVFAHNPAAQALYAGLGFVVTGYNMSKRLAAE